MSATTNKGFYKNLGNSIRTIRMLRKFGQDYMAAKLKIEQSTYCRMEQGYTKIPMDMFFKICPLLEISPFQLLFISGIENYYSGHLTLPETFTELRQQLKVAKDGDLESTKEFLKQIDEQLLVTQIMLEL